MLGKRLGSAKEFITQRFAVAV